MTLQTSLLAGASLLLLLVLASIYGWQTRRLRRAWRQLQRQASELEQRQRNYRNTLQRLPLGACILDEELRIQFWNDRLSHYTGLANRECVGKSLGSLPSPWNVLLTDFARDESSHRAAAPINIDNTPRWFSLHKATLHEDEHLTRVLIIDDETEQQRLSQQVEHQARLASIGRFAAGIAHEIGNPVTAIACLAQELALDSEQPEVLESSRQIRTQTERISRIVQSLIHFAHTGKRNDPSQHEPVNLHTCVDDAIHLVQLDSRASGQQLINAVDEACICNGDSQQLLQVMINLLTNACDACPEDAEIYIDSDCDEHNVTLRITDSGIGIAAEHLPHLFEPFYTTKEPGLGTGLGLPLVYNIITEHYGRIEINSPANENQNKGTQVVITLPRQHHDGNEWKQREP